MGSYESDVKCGRTQLLCESVVNVKPPMYKIIGERFKVNVTECSTYCGNVLVKGTVEKITMYLHEHDHKKDNKKNDGDKKDGKDGKNSKNCKDSNNSKDGKDSKDGDCRSEIEDMSYFKKSYCKQVNSAEGIVHYMETTLKFRAVVEIPGIKHGHECKVEAKVKDVGDFVALECTEKGQVTLGKETYVLDIQVYPK